jgi:cell division protein FtsB
MLDSNPKAIEKIARERYFMKEDNEDIFVFSNDQPQSTSSNETVE